MLYRHLMGLFQSESAAHERIIQRRPIDEHNIQGLNEEYEDRTLIYNIQREQVFLFQRYAPEYLEDLRTQHGISATSIWRRNGHS